MRWLRVIGNGASRANGAPTISHHGTNGNGRPAEHWSRADANGTTNGNGNGHGSADGNGNGYINGNGNGHATINGNGHSNGHNHAPEGEIGTASSLNARSVSAAFSADVPSRPVKRRPVLNGIELDRAVERIEVWLLEWLVERVGLDAAEVDRHRPFAEYGVDSLTAVELSQELEDEFAVELPPIVAWNYPTPAALARYLAEQSTGEVAENGHASGTNGHTGAGPSADSSGRC
jgi:acyl carrier protein